MRWMFDQFFVGLNHDRDRRMSTHTAHQAPSPSIPRLKRATRKSPGLTSELTPVKPLGRRSSIATYTSYHGDTATSRNHEGESVTSFPGRGITEHKVPVQRTN